MLIWLAGLVRRRPGRLAGTAAGVAIAVALLATLGSFLAAARADMTRRAASAVTVDWQVHLAAGADPAAAAATVAAEPGVVTALPVGYAHAAGLSTQDGGGTRTTGAAMVLGLPAGYRTAFPRQVRDLSGAAEGVLLAQQAAANLNAAPGATLSIARAGAPPVRVIVDGVVDLPHADALFAPGGAGAPGGTGGAGGTAPPDNVVLLPAKTFAALFATPGDPQVSVQLHVRRDRNLPADPGGAYTAETAAAHHLDVALAGAGQVSDNLAAALDAARADAAFAAVLFLFLATPAAVLAAVLTATVVGSGATRRRREQALLRTRGAGPARVLGTAAIEALLVAALGSVAGLGLAVLIRPALAAGGAASPRWWGVAVLAGVVIAVATVVLPAWRSLRAEAVRAGRTAIPEPSRPLWLRLGVDVIALAGAAAVFAATASGGYKLVLAPEGAPRISVDYWAFAGPALLWLGAALLAWRLVELGLRRGRRPLAWLLRPFAGPLAGTVAASLSRQRRPIATAVTVLAAAFAFAVSTSTFNATYRQQAEVDARLTNGADVTVTAVPGAPDLRGTLAATRGVRHVEVVGHRFAYVGADLQDMYAVDPATVTGGAHLSDAYFTGATAAELMRALTRQPDGVLVSAETVLDYRLRPGDRITLRLPGAGGAAPVSVPFRFIGGVKELPTAPTDSFLVANREYLRAAGAGTGAATYLLDTGGRAAASVAADVRQRVGPAATVTDIATARGTVGSSLTAVGLTGLTRIELGFALALAAAAAGLVLGLSLAERRRAFTIAAALGATRRHLTGFVAGEAAVITVPALLLGGALGYVLSRLLVAVLTGVFDPPPDRLAVPWGYLAAALAAILAAVLATVAALIRRTAEPDLTLLRQGT
jgi:putative ABC transport system permease protein